MLRRYSGYSRVGMLVVSVVVIAVLGLGFYLGQRATYSGLGIDPASYRALMASEAERQGALETLQSELDMQKTRNEVDRGALELVRSDIANQKQEIAELQEGLQFYRSLMAPGEIAQGLSLRTIELVSREAPGVFAYRIVAQQEARKHATVKGELYIEVFGRVGEESVSYPLSSLSDDMDSNVVTLRFKYFQSIEGELALPEGFEPESINVVATATKPRKAEVREQFPWQVKERFTHVGK
ncbi:MAG: DUF6776 family protein [Halioglobus sp.]